MLMPDLDGHLTGFHAGRSVKWDKFSLSMLITLGLGENEAVSLSWIWVHKKQPSLTQGSSSDYTVF